LLTAHDSVERMDVKVIMSQSGVIIRPLLPQWPELDSAAQETVVRQANRFVQSSIALAPAHVRFGVSVASTALWAWILLYRSGANRSGARQRKAVALFERLPGPAAAVVRLYRSLTVLAFYEHPLVLRAMNVGEPEARQEKFRAERRSILRSSGGR
jgi:hypothetical protein